MTLLKSIVVVLALANVSYFLWTRGIAHPEADAAPSAATLKLASEVPGSQRAGAGANDDQASSSAAGIVGAGGGVDAPGVAMPGGASGVPAPSPGSAALLTNVKRCISVGPFRDVSETAHAASTLRSGGYDPRQRVAEGEVWAGVWVYLPIPPARSSEQMLAKLKAAGIEDALMQKPNLDAALPSGRDRNIEPLILLAHEPDFADFTIGRQIDLVLSGHTHGGQILLPFMPPLLLPYLGTKYVHGLFKLRDGMQLYVNRGIGAVNLPFRFRCPPEITLITLQRES